MDTTDIEELAARVSLLERDVGVMRAILWRSAPIQAPPPAWYPPAGAPQAWYPPVDPAQVQAPQPQAGRPQTAGPQQPGWYPPAGLASAQAAPQAWYPPPAPWAPGTALPAATRPGLTGSQEARFAGTWFARAGALAVLVGAAFAFKYGMDQGIITPGVRILIGLAAGLALILWGAWAKRRTWDRLAQAVTAGGLGVCFLSVLVAHSAYHLISGPVALACLIALTAGNAALAGAYNSQPLALLATVMAMVNPLLAFPSGDPPLAGIYAYLLVAGAGIATTAWIKRWRTLAIVGGALGFVMPLAIIRSGPAHPGSLFLYAATVSVGLAVLAVERDWRALDPVALAGAWLLAVFGLRASGTALGLTYMGGIILALAAVPFVRAALNKGPVSVRDGVLIAVTPAAFLPLAMVLVGRSHPGARVVPTAILAVAYAVAGLAAWHGRRQDRLLAQVPFGVAVAGTTLALGQLFAGFALADAWAAEGLLVMALATRVRSRIAQVAAAVVTGLGALVVLGYFLAGNYTPARVLATIPALQVGAQVAMLAALSVVLSRDGNAETRRVWYPAAAIAANALALIWLSAEAVAHFPVAPGQRPGQTLLFSLSAIWGLYAAALLVGGLVAKLRWARLAALGLFGVTIVKMLVLDLWTLTTGQRVLAFIGLGAVLLACSVLYHRFKDLVLGPDEAPPDGALPDGARPRTPPGGRPQARVP